MHDRLARLTAGLLHSRHLLSLLLLGMFAWSLSRVAWGSDLVNDRGGAAVWEIFSSFFSMNLDSLDVWRLGVVDGWRTVSYAVAGMTVALAIGLPLGVLASGVLASGVWRKRAGASGVRFVLAFLRSIHELVWAWLFVVTFGLSPMAAVLALGIPYGGILGRVYSELLQDVPEGPLRALRNAGASEWQVLLYGRIPAALPDILSYTFYRLECGIRAAAILSFVGLGGLGQRIELALNDLDYETAWAYILLLIVLVTIVDIWSSLIRRGVKA